MKNFTQLPLIIKFYLIFSLIVVLFFTITLAYFKNFYEKLVPHVGWGPTTSYMFSLATSIPILLYKTQPNESINYRFIYGVIGFHIIGIIYGLESISLNEGNHLKNPYLTVGKYRYLWVVIIPILWIISLTYERFKLLIKGLFINH